MDGKGHLRSVWTHRVGSALLQFGGVQPHVVHELYAGSPSKAANNPHLARLHERGKQPGCFIGRLDREILCNALACAGASMADPLMSMVDTYYSGKLGTTALAALGANGALYSVIYFLCFTALAVLCTQAMAAANSRGDAEGCGRGFLQALAATWLVGTVLVAVLVMAPEQVLRFFTEPKIMPFAKTYCMIRALSLPAALSINVCQAAFRSLLDLTTPFCVVMAANAANYLLDHLLMFGLGWGMAGCGWASVISQYLGALLFAIIIYHRRHRFGIPAALSAAAVHYTAESDPRGCFDWCLNRLCCLQHSKQQKGQNHLSSHSSNDWLQGSAISGVDVERRQSDSFRINMGASLKAPHGSDMLLDTCEAMGHISPDDSNVITARATSLLHRARESQTQDMAGEHTSVRLETAHGEQGATRRLSTASEDNQQIANNLKQLSQQPKRYHSPQRQQSRRQQHKQLRNHQRHQRSSSSGPSAAAPTGWGDAVRQVFDYRTAAGDRLDGCQAVDLGQQQSPQRPGESDHAAGQHMPGSGRLQLDDSRPTDLYSAFESHCAPDVHCVVGSQTDLRRLDSVGSDSKLPRLPARYSSWQQLIILLVSLEWGAFVRRFLGMTVRGLLILSVYTSANVVAATGGAITMAAHQHVGQSMTANIFHASSSTGGGPKAARRLAQRIISWAMCICVALAVLTYNNRWLLSGIFTKDVEVRHLVSQVTFPATTMLSLAWNNALEGCLLASGDQAYVVKVYPWASVTGIATLLAAHTYNWKLLGVWCGLMMYYLVLLLGFGARFWGWRCKI